MSPLTPPPLLPPTVPLSSAGGIAALTVSVLTGWDSPNCRPPPVGWGRWNRSAASAPCCWLEDTALLLKACFFFSSSATEHLIEANYPWKTSQNPLSNFSEEENPSQCPRVAVCCAQVEARKAFSCQHTDTIFVLGTIQANMPEGVKLIQYTHAKWRREWPLFLFYQSDLSTKSKGSGHFAMNYRQKKAGTKVCIRADLIHYSSWRLLS